MALCLALARTAPGYTRGKLFTVPLAECEFTDYCIDTTSVNTLGVAPLFSQKWEASQALAEAPLVCPALNHSAEQGTWRGLAQSRRCGIQGFLQADTWPLGRMLGKRGCMCTSHDLRAWPLHAAAEEAPLAAPGWHGALNPGRRHCVGQRQLHAERARGQPERSGCGTACRRPGHARPDHRLHFEPCGRNEGMHAALSCLALFASAFAAVHRTADAAEGAACNIAPACGVCRKRPASCSSQVYRRLSRSQGPGAAGLGRIVRRREASKRAMAAPASTVTLLRAYRKGELPDIDSLSLASFFDPLGASQP